MAFEKIKMLEIVTLRSCCSAEFSPFSEVFLTPSIMQEGLKGTLVVGRCESWQRSRALGKGNPKTRMIYTDGLR